MVLARMKTTTAACCGSVRTGTVDSGYLWDMVSMGTLVAFAIVSAAIPVIRARRLIPYVDIAYQGFGDGIEEDAFAIRALADAGIV